MGAPMRAEKRSKGTAVSSNRSARPFKDLPAQEQEIARRRFSQLIRIHLNNAVGDPFCVVPAPCASTSALCKSDPGLLSKTNQVVCGALSKMQVNFYGVGPRACW